MAQLPYVISAARDILYLKRRVPVRRVVRQKVIANRDLHELRVVVPSPYVTSVEAAGGCSVGPVEHTEDSSEFDLTLTNGVPQGHPATFAYRTHLAFPPGHVTRECRSFAPTGLHQGQVIVVFDEAAPPWRVYNTAWAGPSDGTVMYESEIVPGALDVRDNDAQKWHTFPLAALVDMPALPGTTFGVRWEWLQGTPPLQQPTPRYV